MPKDIQKIKSLSMAKRFTLAKQTLESIGQDHVLGLYDQLGESHQEILLSQIENLEWPDIARCVDPHVKSRPQLEIQKDLQPAPWYPYQPPCSLQGKYDQARRCGEQLVRQGKVAVFTVAGGQASRLGWDAPKGIFAATPITHTSLFGCLAQFINKVQQKYVTTVPWYIMTSPTNHAATRDFLEKYDFFGLDENNVMLFTQGMIPAIDLHTARVLLESPWRLALSPNGHGGSLKALYTSGAIADMQRRGIEQISYTQIDNPLVRAVDPLFVGLHTLDDAQMSSKMLPKAYPKEKLGNFCLADGKMTVIEYSDLPDELAEQRGDNGELCFRAGSIAIHVIRVDFVKSLNEGTDRFALPYHRAEKPVPYLDLETGENVAPEQPNAIKLETFVFDALPLCDRSIVYETDRIEEFAPIKNADGPDALDCPRTSREIQIERAARWLESYGVHVPRNRHGQSDAIIEIQPETAIEPQDLDGTKLPETIEHGSELLL